MRPPTETHKNPFGTSSGNFFTTVIGATPAPPKHRTEAIIFNMWNRDELGSEYQRAPEGILGRCREGPPYGRRNNVKTSLHKETPAN